MCDDVQMYSAGEFKCKAAMLAWLGSSTLPHCMLLSAAAEHYSLLHASDFAGNV
jgi:hypothetical protein